MELHLRIIGILLIMLAMIHAGFAKYFNWKLELSNLNLINRQMMQTHTFFVALTVLIMGILCLINVEELITTQLGKQISCGLALFWTCRLFFQLFVYSPKLWRGKRFETIVHIIFTLLWIYISSIFWWIVFS